MISSPFFLFCTACKTTYLDEDCSVSIYEMLQMSLLLQKIPCSSGQTQRLINAFSGHGNQLAHADLMHEVAVAVSEHDPGSRVCEG